MLAILASLQPAGEDKPVRDPRPPPCVDLVLIGTDEVTEWYRDAEIKNDILGHAWYPVEFVPQRALSGDLPSGSIKHWVISHSLARRITPRVGFFQVLKAGPQVVGMPTIIEDINGRPFLIYPDDGIRDEWLAWRPLKPSRFQRPILVDRKRLLSAGYGYLFNYVRRGEDRSFRAVGKDRFLTSGIYVDDLMTMFAETRGLPCRRWRGDLALWRPSR
jgi:hypothetical protein